MANRDSPPHQETFPHQEAQGYFEEKDEQNRGCDEDNYKKTEMKAVEHEEPAEAVPAVVPATSNQNQSEIATEILGATGPMPSTSFDSGCGDEESNHTDTQTFSSRRSIKNRSPSPNAVPHPSTPEMDFWLSVDGSGNSKEWRDLKKSMEKLLEGSAAKKRSGDILKLVGHTLGVPAQQSLAGKQSCHLDDFKRMLKWFGPFTVEKDGCFMQILHLMDKSTRQREKDGINVVESWFAGYMTKGEAEERLEKKEIEAGTFLVKFSESYADEGCFSLSLRCENEVISCHIQRCPDTCKLYVNENKLFDSLPALVEHYKKAYVCDESHQLLIRPCPDLPLNSLCKGYKDLRGGGRGMKRGGRGLGRGGRGLGRGSQS